jgi:hypothetical protein
MSIISTKNTTKRLIRGSTRIYQVKDDKGLNQEVEMETGIGLEDQEEARHL